MRWMIAICACAMMTGCGITRAIFGAKPAPTVLIVDGMNNHDWPRATRILKEILDDSGRFARVDVSTSPPPPLT